MKIPISPTSNTNYTRSDDDGIVTMPTHSRVCLAWPFSGKRGAAGQLDRVFQINSWP
ncbi:hypothetical protein M569_11300 [Genlisea aurea]|uniref:Uncharacterized protein n=1 Tax=Genlisea aurea TaxID=192259 RepID=S8C984_9LAMI|nr:hypothetical protein M569_11300 [Genlisea aurea]